MENQNPGVLYYSALALYKLIEKKITISQKVAGGYRVDKYIISRTVESETRNTIISIRTLENEERYHAYAGIKGNTADGRKVKEYIEDIYYYMFPKNAI